MFVVFVQAEDGIRDLVRSRGLGDVYKRQMADSLGKEEEKLKMQMNYQSEVRRKNRTLNILLILSLIHI